MRDYNLMMKSTENPFEALRHAWTAMNKGEGNEAYVWIHAILTGDLLNSGDYAQKYGWTAPQLDQLLRNMERYKLIARAFDFNI